MELAEQPSEDEIGSDLSYLMVWYSDVRNQALRGQHYEPIMLQEILAYEHFLEKLDIAMTAFDWEMLLRLDRVYTDSIPKTPEEEKARKKLATQKKH